MESNKLHPIFAGILSNFFGINESTKKNPHSYWFCHNCKCEICNENVTFEELHDSCGHPVECITTFI